MVTNNLFLTLRKVSEVSHSFKGNYSSSYYGLRDHGTHSSAGFPFTCRPSSQHRAFTEGISLFRTKPKANISSVSESVGCQAQLAWRRLYVMCLCRGGFFSPSIRKVGYSSLAFNRSRLSRSQEYGKHSTGGLGLSCRAHMYYKAFRERNASFKIYRAKGDLYNSLCVKKIYVSLANGSTTYQAQLAWKRLSKMCAYRGLFSRTADKIACAMSLAFTRFNLVPSVLAVIGGELACSKIAWADGEYYPTGNNLYMRAQDGHVYTSLMLFSVLELLILLLRAVYLAVLFSPIIVMVPFAETLGTQYRKTWLQLVHRTLEKARPSLIKWGQWAATRPDLFPEDLCNELAKLHSKAPAHSFAYTKRTIENAFSRNISDIFEDFEEEPVASGSVAQIH